MVLFPFFQPNPKARSDLLPWVSGKTPGRLGGVVSLRAGGQLLTSVLEMQEHGISELRGCLPRLPGKVLCLQNRHSNKALRMDL